MKRLIRLSVLSLFLLAACGTNTVEELVMWSDRVVGYTDTAQQLVTDFHTEGFTKKEPTLSALRGFQRFHNMHMQWWAIIEKGLDTSARSLTLTSAAKGKLEALSDGMAVELGPILSVADGVSSQQSLRLAPLLSVLEAATTQLSKRVKEIELNAGGVVTISFNEKQYERFETESKAVLAKGDKISQRLDSTIANIEQ